MNLTWAILNLGIILGTTLRGLEQVTPKFVSHVLETLKRVAAAPIHEL